MPLYQVPFGPIVDGVAIASDPADSIRAAPFDVDVLFGLTQIESFQMFTESMSMYRDEKDKALVERRYA